MVEEIRKYISSFEVLAGLAEESAELAQAALKLRRALTGANPTPLPADACRRELYHEIADVLVYLQVLGFRIEPPDQNGIPVFMDFKKSRWLERLKEERRWESQIESVRTLDSDVVDMI